MALYAGLHYKARDLQLMHLLCLVLFAVMSTLKHGAKWSCYPAFFLRHVFIAFCLHALL